MRNLQWLVIVLVVSMPLASFLSGPAAGDDDELWSWDRNGIIASRYFGDNILVTMGNNIKVIDRNGTELWSYNGQLYNSRDSLVLDNGNILVVDSSSQNISEINTNTKEIVWYYMLDFTPQSIEIVDDGNVLVSGEGAVEERSILPDNNSDLIWRYDGNGSYQDASKTPEGKYLISDYQNNIVFESDMNWSYYGIQSLCSFVLPDGNILLSSNDNRIIILNRTVGIIHEYPLSYWPRWVDYNPDTNNILVSNHLKIVEYNVDDIPISQPYTNVSDVPDDAGGSVDVHWDPIPSDLLDYYEVYYNTEIFSNISNTSSIKSVNISKTFNETTISNLTNNQTYYFSVVPVNLKGLKLISVNTVQGMAIDNRDLTPPEIVYITNLSSNSSTSIHAEWSISPADDFGRYELYMEIETKNVSNATPTFNLTDRNTTSTDFNGTFLNQTYYVSVAVLDTSNNFLEPTWHPIRPYFPPVVDNQTANDTPIDNGSDNNTNNGTGESIDDEDGERDDTDSIIPKTVLSVVILVGVLGTMVMLGLSLRREKIDPLLDEIDEYIEETVILNGDAQPPDDFFPTKLMG